MAIRDIPKGCRLIFRPWRTDPKTGRRIYPRSGRVFPMIVPIEDDAKPGPRTRK